MYSLKGIADAINRIRSRECDPTALLRGGRQVRRLCTALLGAAAECEVASPDEEHKARRRRITLRSRALEAMIDVLLLLRPRRALRRTPAWKLHRCGMQLAALKTLVLLGKRESAMPLVRGLHRRAAALEATGIQLETSLLLRQNAALSGERRAFEQYSEETRRLRDLRDAEVYAAELVQRHMLDAHVLGRRRRAVGLAASHYFANLEDLRRIHNSRALTNAWFQLRIQAAMALDRLPQTLRLCEDYHAFLRGGTQPVAASHLLRVELLRLHCLVRADDERAFDLGEKLARRCDRGEINWHAALQQTTILALRRGDYALAGRLLRRARAAHKAAGGGTPLSLAARWALVEHNLNALGLTGKPPDPAAEFSALPCLRRGMPVWEMDAALLVVVGLTAAAADAGLRRRCLDLLDLRPAAACAPRSELLLRLLAEHDAAPDLALLRRRALTALADAAGRDECELIPFEVFCRRATPRRAAARLRQPGKRADLRPEASSGRPDHFSVSQSMISIIETSSW